MNFLACEMWNMIEEVSERGKGASGRALVYFNKTFRAPHLRMTGYRKGMSQEKRFIAVDS